MTIVWLLFLLQAAHAGKITPEENYKLKERCNTKWTVQANKYKRYQVDQSNYPFAVALSEIRGTRYDFNRGVDVVESFTLPFCSGVLISPRHILTAAHCLIVDKTNACKQGLILQEETAQKVGVFLQSCNYLGCWEDQGVRRVASVHVHQDYGNVDEACKNSTSYDIAVIELEQNADSEPICMPQRNDVVPQRVESIGYGNNGGDFSIQAVTYDRTSEKPENKAIEAYTKYKEESIIPGDSGGSLIYQLEGKHYLIGISASSVKNVRERPWGWEFTGEVWSRFVDVRKHLEWICDWTGVCPLSGDSGNQDQPPSNGDVFEML